MHPLKNIIEEHLVEGRVTPGEYVTIHIDVAGVNDLYLQVIEAFEAMGGGRVWAPGKVCFFLDHYAPPSTIKAATNQRVLREFARKQGIERVFDVNAGVCHQLLVDHRLVRPGSTVAVTDSHTTTHGACGAFSTGVGATDMAAILLTGKLWIRVPEIIRVEIQGKLSTGVMAKDVILHVLKILRADGAVYKAIEYTGSTVYELPLDQRSVLTNMSVEMGAQSTYIAPDEACWEYYNAVTSPHLLGSGDSDELSDVIQCDVTELTPQVALPEGIDRVVDVAEVAGTRVDQVYIGSCTGGRLTDLAVAAGILEEQVVAKGTRLLVSPASRGVYLRALQEGYLETIVGAGGTILNPGCGPCLGIHQGLLASGEVCVSAASRNFPGRMGSREARIFVTSPATAAMTAVRGRIASPLNR